MTRKSMSQLVADLLTSFPDNTTGLITPAVLRAYLTSVIEAIQPAYGLLSRSTTATQALTTTSAPLVFESGFASDVPDYATVAATGTIQRLAAGTCRIVFNVDASVANNQVVVFELWKDGVLTPWSCTLTGTGVGEPIGTGFAALVYSGAAATYQLRARTIGAAATVTFHVGEFLLETVPVYTY